MEEERKYSADIAAAVNKFLVDDDWRFDFNEGEGCFRFTLTLDGKLKEARYWILINEDDYTVYAYSPIGADKGDERMMSAMADFAPVSKFMVLNTYEIEPSAISSIEQQ